MNVQLTDVSAGIKNLFRPMTGAPDWEAVYAGQLPRVYNFFRYRVQDGATAEDLTAATFERAWRGRHTYRADVAGFSTWLFSIARNVAADHFRVAAQHDETPLDENLAADEAASPAQAICQMEDFARLSRLLAALPARERELLALKYGAQLTNRAIASITSLSESNVGTIINRTVNKLRKEW